MSADWTGIVRGGLMTAVTLALVLYPTGKILRRMGFSPLLAIAAVIPPINLIALWFLAFIEWPNAPTTGSSPEKNSEAPASGRS